MKKYYKFLKFNPEDLSKEAGNYPVEHIVPFGPAFEAKDDAKTWLKQNAEKKSAYMLERFYSLELPVNLVAETKKEKQPENPVQDI